MVVFRSVQSPRVTAVVAAVAGTPGAPEVAAGLAALAAAAGGPAAIGIEVVVAGTEADPDLDAALAGVEGVTMLRLPGGTGWAAAVDAAAGRARGEHLLLLDAGTRLAPDALVALLATARRRPGCGVVAGRGLAADGTVLEAGPLLWADGTLDPLGGAAGDAAGPFDFERRVDAAAGPALLVDRRLWETVGGLDGTYHPAVAAEKVELCLRAAEQGWATWYQPAAQATRPAGAPPGAPGVVEPAALPVLVGRWSARLRGQEAPGHWEQALRRAGGEPTRVLVIDDELPDPRRGSGYGRMHDVLQVLDGDLGLQVAFHPRLTPPPLTVAERAGLLGPRARLVTDLDGYLGSDGVDVDVVVVSRPANAERYRPVIDRRLAGRPVVYDAEALFFRRLERQAEVAEPDARAGLLEQAASMRALERDLASWADQMVTISEDEADTIRPFTRAPVHVVGPRRRGAHPTASAYEARSGACLVAGWAAGPGSPNADGLRWFARDVLPRIRAQLPAFRLLVTGDDPPPDVTWAAGPAVEFVGGLPDLGELYDRVRVAISPTRFGAGVKLKTVEAVQHGVPVVCTLEAAAGLGADLAAAVWVAADAPAFADAVVALAGDRRAWERARRAALAAATGGGEGPGGIEQWPGIIREALAAPTARRTA